jgi:hypothetical protein
MEKITLIFVLLISIIGYGQEDGKGVFHATNITTTGEVSQQGLTHAEMVAELISYTPNLTQNVYTRFLPTFSTTENDGFTIAGDSITIIKAGSYSVNFTRAFQGGNNEDYNIAICKNGVRVRTIRRTTMGANNYVGGNAFKYLDNLVAGDDISIKITNITNSGDPTFFGAYIFIQRLY